MFHRLASVLLGCRYQPWPCRAVPEPVAQPLCALPPYPPPGTHRSLMDGWCRSRPNPEETDETDTGIGLCSFRFNTFKKTGVGEVVSSTLQLHLALAFSTLYTRKGASDEHLECANTPTQTEALSSDHQESCI